MSAGLGVDANVTGTGVKVDAHSASNNYEEFDVQKAAKWYVVPGGNSPNDLGFVNSSFAQTLTLQQGGNVGIGTMSPAYKLDVSGGNIRVNQDGDVNDSVLIGDIGSTYPGVWFGSNAISPSYINYSFLWDKTLGTLLNAPSGVNGTTFRIANNPVAAINANGMAIGYGNASATTPSSGNGLIVAGNVGIGTTTPSQALDVNGNVNIESGNGFLMRDTVLGTCKLITLTSGVLVGTTHACQ
jgi:hypothetical protein